MNRRAFCRAVTALAAGMIAGGGAASGATPEGAPRRRAQETDSTAPVAFIRTRDRAEGVRRALDLLGVNPIRGKRLFLKANYNSADPTPGSTHPEALAALVGWLRANGAEGITLGDRSGMGATRRVLRTRGVFDLAADLDFDTLVFDELDAGGWVMIRPEESHWADGFPFVRAALEADGVVQTCCLKTHRYGGHFTLSLKNSVGLVAARLPGGDHNYMNELHGSRFMREMIAEINLAYTPDLIVLDGVEAFVDGGPDRGTTVEAQVILAGTDRVALDAVGVALLRYFGTTSEVSAGAIFEQAQIARAAALGLGVSGPEQIALLTDDPASAAYAAEVRAILLGADPAEVDRTLLRAP